MAYTYNNLLEEVLGHVGDWCSQQSVGEIAGFNLNDRIEVRGYPRVGLLSANKRQYIALIIYKNGIGSNSKVARIKVVDERLGYRRTRHRCRRTDGTMGLAHQFTLLLLEYEKEPYFFDFNHTLVSLFGKQEEEFMAIVEKILFLAKLSRYQMSLLLNLARGKGYVRVANSIRNVYRNKKAIQQLI